MPWTCRFATSLEGWSGQNLLSLLFRGSGAKAEIVYGDAGQPFAEVLQQLAFVKLNQLSQERGIVHFHFKHAAPQSDDASVLGAFFSNGFGPRHFQAKLFLPPTPAAGREQATEDLAQQFGSLFDF
jgi:hypothetical protein